MFKLLNLHDVDDDDDDDDDGDDGGGGDNDDEDDNCCCIHLGIHLFRRFTSSTFTTLKFLFFSRSLKAS